ncbi:MAG: hypothetical protein ACTSRW_05155 [Candidatus Helarchaeota archaeon]
MVSGIKRSSLAAESARQFTTPDLLTLKFRREQDFEKILELTDEESDLLTYILSACAIHLYHHMDIKTLEMKDEQLLTYEAEHKFDRLQKKALLDELSQIIGKNVIQELELFEKKTRVLKDILNVTMQLKNTNNPVEKEELEQERGKLLHQFVLSLFRKYPDYFFFDQVGDLFGLTIQTRMEMIQLASELKITQMDISEEFKREYSETLVELGTFTHLREFFTKKWELKGAIRQLETQKVTFRRIENELMNKIIESFPFSQKGQKASIDALHLKLKIIDEFKKHVSTPRSFRNLEKDISKLVRFEIYKQALESPQSFVDFFSRLLDLPFNDVMEFFRKVRISNIPAFCQMLAVPVQIISKKLSEMNIRDMDLTRLSEKGGLNIARQKFEEKKSQRHEAIISMSFEEFVKTGEQYPDLRQFSREFLSEITLSLRDLQDLLEKEKILKNEILIPFQVVNVDNLRLALSSIPILTNLEKEIFYHVLKNILRHISRLIEQYEKLKKDKEIFLLALKKIPQLTESENWIQVKLEDLIIKKIMARQKEFHDLFRFNNSHLINGFLWARLSNSSFQDASKIIKETPSPVYHGLYQFPLTYEEIPPVSFASAYDLTMRLQASLKLKETKIIEARAKSVAKEKPMTKIEDIETFSWIEKRIKTAIMRVGKISPTDLYWTDEDTKKFGSNFLLHVQVMDAKKICPECGAIQVDNCPKHQNGSLIRPNKIQAMASYYQFASEKIGSKEFSTNRQEVEEITKEVMKERLGRDPIADEYKQLLEGEIRLIGEKLAEKVGQKFNKTLYKKYRKTKLGK